MSVYWQDRYITEDSDGYGYIIWDMYGEYLASTDTKKEARNLISKLFNKNKFDIKVYYENKSCGNILGKNLYSR